VRDSGHWVVSRRRLVQKHPQHPRLASAEELDVKDFEPARGRDPVRYRPHTFNVKRHESNDLLADGRNTDGAPTISN
jgi:hypothetical protein